MCPVQHFSDVIRSQVQQHRTGPAVKIDGRSVTDPPTASLSITSPALILDM